MPTEQDIVTLDFESRSETDLTKVGQWIYANDESTDILCVCFARNNEEVDWSKGPKFGSRKPVLRKLHELAADKSILFEAHNASFEYCMWKYIMHKRHGFPMISYKRWRCSASVASYKALPRGLGDLAKALGAEHQKDEEGKRVMMKMCKPVPERVRHLHGEWHESDADFDKLISYCIDDVKTERACSNILGHLPPDELKTWLLDFKINMRGIHVDQKFIESANDLKDKIKKRINKECKDLVGFTPGQVQKLKPWLKSKGVEVPTKKDKKTKQEKETLSAEGIKKMLADPAISEEVKRILRLRRDFGTQSLAKLNAALRMSDKNGVVRWQFMYHGATTGRWSGKGIQFQNLPRGNFPEDTVQTDTEDCCNAIIDNDLEFIDNWYSDIASNMGIMKSCLRGMVVSGEGRILRVMDWSQIEARVLPWLAGQRDVLLAFKEGKDLYKYTASQIYTKDYEIIDKDERFIGKTASLALGYQGGKGAFISMALNFGVLVEPKLAEKIKNDWRKRNRQIVKFWYALERAAIRTIQTRHRTRVCGKITFAIEGDFLTMKLPSGRKLHYYKPMVKERRIETDEGGFYTKQSVSYMGSDSARGIKWGRVYTYGGKLAENATQAVSRDLMVIGMHKLDAAGYRIIIHVHDEIVTEDDPSHGSLDDMKAIILKKPRWAKGLPVDADGFEATRYYKG